MIQGPAFPFTKEGAIDKNAFVSELRDTMLGIGTVTMTITADGSEDKTVIYLDNTDPGDRRVYTTLTSGNTTTETVTEKGVTWVRVGGGAWEESESPDASLSLDGFARAGDTYWSVKLTDAKKRVFEVEVDQPALGFDSGTLRLQVDEQFRVERTELNLDGNITTTVFSGYDGFTPIPPVGQ